MLSTISRYKVRRYIEGYEEYGPYLGRLKDAVNLYAAVNICPPFEAVENVGSSPLSSLTRN